MMNDDHHSASAGKKTKLVHRLPQEVGIHRILDDFHDISRNRFDGLSGIDTPHVDPWELDEELVKQCPHSGLHFLSFIALLTVTSPFCCFCRR